MAGLTPQALEVLKNHHGVATQRMLHAAGVGRDARRRLLGSGVLAPASAGVYRIVSSPETLESRCAALSLAYPRGFVTGPTAGKLLRMRRMPRVDEIHFAVPHGSNIGPRDGVVLRQTTSILLSDVQTRRRDGIVVASAPRLAFDLGADLSVADLVAVIERLLRDKWCSYAAMLITARRLIHPNRAGSVTAAVALEAIGARTPAGSHPEVALGDALRSRAVPVEQRLNRLRLPNGRAIRIDLAVPSLRWAVEIDVRPDHLLLDGTTRYCARRRQCQLIDWQIERVTRLDLTDLDGVADELAVLYQARLRAFAA
ncbi:MAG: hypothetical protein ABIQ39_03415 [Ilumatobacteraceae bacterium]